MRPTLQYLCNSCFRRAHREAAREGLVQTTSGFDPQPRREDGRHPECDAQHSRYVRARHVVAFVDPTSDEQADEE